MNILSRVPGTVVELQKSQHLKGKGNFPAVPDLSAKSQEIISLERVKYADALFNYCLRSRSDGPPHFAQLIQIIDVLERQQRMQKDLHLLLVAPKVAKLPKDLVMRVIEDIMDS